MDSLKDLLASKNLEQPSELKSIQDYLDKHLGFNFKIFDHPKHITIAVGNGKIAYLLRTKLADLTAYAAPTKPIYIKIDRGLDEA